MCSQLLNYITSPTAKLGINSKTGPLLKKTFFLTIDHSLSYKLHFKRFSSYKNVKLSKNKTLFYKILFFRDKEILNHFMIILIYRMDIFKYLNQFSKYLSTYLSIMDQSTIFLFICLIFFSN